MRLACGMSGKCCGAREAGILNFIDIKLSAYEGFWEPTYRDAPYAKSVDPKAGGGDTSDKRFVLVNSDELARYGFQSMLTPRESYRLGLAALNSTAKSVAGSSFADASEAQQDQIVGTLEDGSASGFSTVKAVMLLS